MTKGPDDEVDKNHDLHFTLLPQITRVDKTVLRMICVILIADDSNKLLTFSINHAKSL